MSRRNIRFNIEHDGEEYQVYVYRQKYTKIDRPNDVAYVDLLHSEPFVDVLEYLSESDIRILFALAKAQNRVEKKSGLKGQTFNVDLILCREYEYPNTSAKYKGWVAYW